MRDFAAERAFIFLSGFSSSSVSQVKHDAEVDVAGIKPFIGLCPAHPISLQ
jgi:hypothetical protein